MKAREEFIEREKVVAAAAAAAAAAGDGGASGGGEEEDKLVDDGWVDEVQLAEEMALLQKLKAQQQQMKMEKKMKKGLLKGKKQHHAPHLPKSAFSPVLLGEFGEEVGQVVKPVKP